MNRPTALIIAALVVLLGGPALAAPPTVPPSPGYDARLQESRKPAAVSADQLSIPPSTPPTVPRHHARRTQARH
jgi:hypothetical protein